MNSNNTLYRRTLMTAASSLALSSAAFGHPANKLRVGVIGHTGRGNYGHGLDSVWLRLPASEIVGVADADEAGLAGAKKKLRVDKGFIDYRSMLAQADPDIVAVCPRHPDQHRDMVLAAIAAGAKGVYVEKPFCKTPAESDEIVAACEQHGTKLAVAHRNRYHPTLQAIERLIAEGTIGKLLEIRGRGKGDRRGGAEDLWVLGSHVLNLINFFGGQAKSCSAMLLQNGQRAGKKDIREGNEGLGLLAGNEVHARYQMERGFVAYFDSLANDGTRNAGFGLQIIGSEGIVDIHCDKHPLAHLIPGNPFEPKAQPRPWIPITSAGLGKPEPIDDLADRVDHHVAPALDLIDSIRADRQPLCSVYEGATTVEMICAVFASHRLSSKEIQLPQAYRENALEQM